MTLAGTGEAGYSGDGAAAAGARVNNPFGITLGPDGLVYFCDTGNHVVRRIGADGTITTIAGTGEPGYSGDGGDAKSARLNEPYEVRFDSDGNLFFVEMKSHVVRRVDAVAGTISTVAGTGEAGFSGDGGAATEATFRRPHSIQFGPDGALYICDIGNHRLRKVTAEGTVTTVAGNGERGPIPDRAPISPDTPLSGPRAIDFDRDGNLWLALREGNAILRLDLRANTIHHVAGSGEKGFAGNGGRAREADLAGPKGIAVGPDGNVYFADTESHTIRKIDLAKGTVELVAGTGKKGDGTSRDPLRCALARPHGVYVDGDGTVYIGDSEAHKVRALRR